MRGPTRPWLSGTALGRPVVPLVKMRTASARGSGSALALALATFPSPSRSRVPSTEPTAVSRTTPA